MFDASQSAFDLADATRRALAVRRGEACCGVKRRVAHERTKECVVPTLTEDASPRSRLSLRASQRYWKLTPAHRAGLLIA